MVQSIVRNLQNIEFAIPIEYKKADISERWAKIYYEAKQNLVNKILQDKTVSDFYGQFYSEHKELQIQGGKELIEKCKFYDGQKILDVGCGDGFFAFEMAKKANVEVDGVDYAKDLIDIAKQKNEQHNIANVKFYHEDYGVFRKENHYDLVFSNFAIHWAGTNHKEWVKNIYDSLRNGGKLIASLSGAMKDNGKKITTFYELSKDNNSIVKMAIKNLHLQKYFKNVEPHSYWAPTEEELESVFETIGFKDIKIKVIIANSLEQTEYNSWADAYNNILATDLNNYYRYLKNDKQKNELYKECFRLCLKFKPEWITAVDLIISAEK